MHAHVLRTSEPVGSRADHHRHKPAALGVQHVDDVSTRESARSDELGDERNELGVQAAGAGGERERGLGVREPRDELRTRKASTNYIFTMYLFFVETKQD